MGRPAKSAPSEYVRRTTTLWRHQRDPMVGKVMALISTVGSVPGCRPWDHTPVSATTDEERRRSKRNGDQKDALRAGQVEALRRAYESGGAEAALALCPNASALLALSRGARRGRRGAGADGSAGEGVCDGEH